MAPVDRARTILSYLAANDIAGTPAMIHHNLELHKQVDWSRDTTHRRLNDFQAVGYVDYYPDIGDGYYAVSTAGSFRVENGITDDELQEAIGTAEYSFDQ